VKLADHAVVIIEPHRDDPAEHTAGARTTARDHGQYPSAVITTDNCEILTPNVQGETLLALPKWGALRVTQTG
jgi:hypothetical protein